MVNITELKVRLRESRLGKLVNSNWLGEAFEESDLARAFEEIYGGQPEIHGKEGAEFLQILSIPFMTPFLPIMLPWAYIDIKLRKYKGD